MTAVMSRGPGADETPDMTQRPILRPTRSPFSRLHAEHRRALDLLRKFESALGDDAPDERSFPAIASYLAGPFRTHLEVEERVVFPVLGENLPELALALEPLREDHASIRDMSESLRVLLSRPGAPRRAEQLLVLGRDLTDLIRLHVRKEERTVLDWSERVLPATVLIELAHRIAHALAPGEARNPEHS
jgi:hemerythrin-like domain-containing protein